jgi:hypothetical protein
MRDTFSGIRSPGDRTVADADARCPNCDHVFAPAEVADEWCASCGKKIPEILMKDLRPRPHLRHPVPLPEPTREERAEATRESRTRAGGMLLMVLAILAGLGCLVWGVIERMNGQSYNPALWVGGVALVGFLCGLGMFATGRAD